VGWQHTFEATLEVSFPQGYTTYKIIVMDEIWLILRDGCHLAAFPSRALADAFVRQMVGAGCAEGKASQVLIENGCESETLLCRCFEERPAGTPLN
jgi:hypothetical protein